VRYKKSVIEVKIRIDPVEGWGHQPEDHVRMLEDYLKKVIPWYKPEVKLIRVENEIRCPDCGATLLVPNPLDDSDYICQECGSHFSEEEPVFTEI
jgi:DNA-directed RNA polymerase subunit RPC12/RpoP